MTITIFLIALLSFSNVFAEQDIVIEEDTRVQITSGNHKSIHDSIGLLHIDFGSSKSYCTGTVIGLNHVITAAHCVISKGKFAEKVSFMPGHNDKVKNKKFPFGKFTATKIFALNSYFRQAVPENDLAVIAFNENLPVTAIKIASQRSFIGEIIIAGYPSDKDFGTLWEGKGYRNYFLKSNAHTVDTASGQSGSAVRTQIANQEVIIGIHSSGHKNNQGKYNTAYFFEPNSIRLINQWMNSR
jgi:V8-like Glu-specific endopeptidase